MSLDKGVWMGKHLTFEERCQLAALHEAGHTQWAIAARIGVSQSTICRELQRNATRRGYVCGPAHEAAAARRSTASSSPCKLTPQVIELIEAMLRDEE